MRARRRLTRALLGILGGFLLANSARAQIELPGGNLSDRIVVAADSGSHWTEGVYDVYLLRGNCLINQGLTYASSREAVVWIERGGAGGEPPHKVIAYLEGDVEIKYQQSAAGESKAAGAAVLKDKTWFGRFYSVLPVDVRPMKSEPEPRVKPEVYGHAVAARDPDSPAKAQPAQFAEPITSPPPVIGPPLGMVRVRVQSRSAVRFQAQAFPVPNTNEWVVIAQSGVNIVVDGIDQFGSIDVDTDNLVIWTEGALVPDAEGQSMQSKDRPLEIYMEGNVVFRQGERTIYANRMYYDVRRQTGIILSAEVFTPVKSFEGLIKLRAEVIQQVGPDRFVAQNASLTSSRFGVPGYELRSRLMTYDDAQQPRINRLTGIPETDAAGANIIDHQKLATSRNNLLYVEEVPVFYWPIIATDLDQPNYYIDSIRVKNDRVFGTQVFTDIDAYQVFGIKNRPPGTKWGFSADYLSKRGPAGGTTFRYQNVDLFDIPKSTTGFIDAWGIDDHGLDNLGLNRRTLTFPRPFRGRILAQHRQILPDNFQLTGELGLISDFNFLEQYFERDWDQLKDQSTDLELKRYLDNSSWSVFGAARLNSFFTETQWLPRLDHFWLGESLLGDRLTWYEHSNLGYGIFRSASPPTDPTDAAQWGPLPWEGSANNTLQGDRVATRQELDLPFSAGVAKFVPYALGELAHWGQALNTEDLSRAYGQLGLRASLPMWSANPAIESQLFNVHGIAHKVVFETDVSYAQATNRLANLPLYDQIDDNDIEAYRRKFTFTDFGIAPPVPLQFDERFYALRRGLGSWVGSPSTEIADSLFAARLGVRQRWQTKRGPVGQQRVVDWIVLNTDFTIFPNANRDNFGQTVGLADYDFRWHVGDRTTLVSDGYFDFFTNAPQYFNVGGFLNRPPRGSMYLGFRSIEGPIHSNVVATSYSYRMSPKWISTFGTSFDIVNARNIGQNFTITRIGESFLMIFNINVDTSKGNVGANFAIQPRFFQNRPGATSGLTGGPISTGMQVPVAGIYGLE
ncbi:MAG: hypothetical protein HY288_13980 [Planctomycetia bacterium]|nr:hypothetical protein [Planctomycetia bacterium]